MAWSEIVFGSLLVLLLVFLSLHYARHQVQALRRLRETPDLPDEEMQYERRKARRRLVSCALTLLLAILLGSLLAFYEGPAHRLAEERQGRDADARPTDEERLFLRVWGGTWIALMLVLMAVLALAAVDLLSTRRYALRQYRKLQSDRRAMIERQAIRMRRDRNGHA